MSDLKPPAGYYPDSSGVQRFWDGERWTEHTQVQDGIPAPPGAPVERPWFKKKRFIIPGAVLGLAVIGGAVGAEEEPSPSTSPSAAPTAEDAATDDESAVEEAVEEEPVVEEEPAFSAGQQNAIGAAENYLDFSGFSRQGLIEQLEYEQYSTADAEFAVDHLDVDWNEQAARVAENYLDFSSFSRGGLIEQLKYDGFTDDQANHGASAAGL